MTRTIRPRPRRHRLRMPATPRSRLLLIVVAVLAVLFLVGSVLFAQFRRDTAQVETMQAQDRTQVVTGQRDAAGAQAAGLAVQIQSACNAGTLRGPVCQTADKVAADPIPGPAGPRGEPGVAGAAGEQGPAGPSGPAGESPPCLTEPTQCRGPAGADGAPGDSITGPTGPQGDPGQSVQGPPGAPGRDGSPAASYTLTYPDGSTQTCTRDGGTDLAPAYTCSAPQPAPILTP